jgi:hypothetical protein
MESTVRIGSETRKLVEADENWVTQQIRRRRQDGQSVCVEVVIHTGALNIRLATPSCGPAGAAGRSPNKSEEEVFDLWNKRGLNDHDFTGGNLVAFLKQFARVI